MTKSVTERVRPKEDLKSQKLSSENEKAETKVSHEEVETQSNKVESIPIVRRGARKGKKIK